MKLPDSKKIQFIDSLWTFSVALAFLGPFALPLLWRNSRFAGRTKVAGSIFIVAFTAALFWFSANFLGQLAQEYQELKSMQESSS